MKTTQRILWVMKTNTRKLLFPYPECSSIYNTTQFTEVKVDSLCSNIL